MPQWRHSDFMVLIFLSFDKRKKQIWNKLSEKDETNQLIIRNVENHEINWPVLKE